MQPKSIDFLSTEAVPSTVLALGDTTVFGPGMTVAPVV